MELKRRNCFRVLGLPVTVSNREIYKRISNLESLTGLCNAKKYLGDLASSKVSARRI